MKRVLPVLTLALVALTTGCFHEDDSANLTGLPKEESAKTEATLRVHLTDAPYPYSSLSSADIAVDAVEVRMNGGYRTLPVDAAPVSMNLLSLQNGVTEMLVDTVVPAGNIDEIRLIISSASVTLSDGRVFDLQIPGGESSGLKISVSPSVQVSGGLTTELLLDFDVSQSFEPVPASAKKAEDINSFKFHPVLRAANLSQSGTVAGHVWSDQGTPGILSDDTLIVGASVNVMSDDASRMDGGTATSDQGFFSVSGLSAGSHLVSVEATGFNPVDLSVDVTVANTTNKEIRLSRASGGSGPRPPTNLK
jgi:hypothetical protein